jgi:hypothetical protein
VRVERVLNSVVCVGCVTGRFAIHSVSLSPARLSLCVASPEESRVERLKDAVRRLPAHSKAVAESLFLFMCRVRQYQECTCVKWFFVYVCICMCVCICVYMCMYIYVYICVCVYIYIYIYVCVCVCVLCVLCWVGYMCLGGLLYVYLSLLIELFFFFFYTFPTVNQMTAHNVAIVFAQILLRPETDSMLLLKNATKTTTTILWMIENYYEVFAVCWIRWLCFTLFRWCTKVFMLSSA